MNSPMNERWNECARAARSAETESAPPMPYGFATRLLSNLAPTVAERLEVWMIFARRGLAFASVVTLAAAAFAWWEDSAMAIEVPAIGIETPALPDNVIEQALWQP